MNRRHLIKLTALSLAGLVAPAAGPARQRADALFKELFGDPGFAAHVGQASLADDETSGSRGRELVAEIASLRPPAGMQRLQERIDADLEALDLVVVDGWVMARAEADLCAAVHLDRNLA
ncbi:MAG: hypothetical protein AAF543_01740 [Pseudomonadota bacterium]